MTTNSKLTIRMNEATKRECEVILNSLGMNMTTGINVFANAVVRHRGIPFDMRLEEPDPFFSPYNQKYLKESFDEAANGNVIKKTAEELGLDNEEY